MDAAIRFLCPRCNCDLGVFNPAQGGAREVRCPACGTLCALNAAGRRVDNPDAAPAVKLVKTGMAAAVRHV